MIVCQYCSYSHPDNTLFCHLCGAYLGEEDLGATNHLPNVDSPAGTGTEIDQVQSLILITEDGTRIQVRISQEVILGRLDASRGVFPNVDLTAAQAAEKGVSREHARISRHGGDLFVVDLNSTNGTFLNSERLVPQAPRLINDGDRLQLARLVLTVRLKPGSQRPRPPAA
jgi:pSer/pThr/pTyr-binding forkhead associated (FHA) protein